MSYHVPITDPCDACGKAGYTEDNPLVEVRQPRPSDPSDVCCIMAGHANCLGGSGQPGAHGGVATPAEWDAWLADGDRSDVLHLG
jgi:hypothetical protein